VQAVRGLLPRVNAQALAPRRSTGHTAAVPSQSRRSESARTVMPALADFARCVAALGGLVASRRLASPKGNLGARLRFADGSSSFVFRETAVTGADTSDPTLLVIQFRLAALGSNRLLHAAFRRECVLHTPLFAGFPGFRSKLWLDDVETGVYRGVYQWEGGELARHYAARMVALLAPFSNAGTARSEVVEGVRRDEFLVRPEVAPAHVAGDWWRLAEPIIRGPAPRPA
jgi:hypothetical protein